MIGLGKSTRKLSLIAATAFVSLLLIVSIARVNAIVPPSITVTPSTFGSGATITVSGTGFPGGSTVLVWLDLYSSGNYVFGEPSTTVKASSTGAFSTNLAVGAVPVGTYSVDAAKVPPPFPTSMASTTVSVVDSSTLSAISSALASLSTSISNLQSDLDSSILSLQTHIDNSISAATSTITTELGSISTAISNFQSDIDSRLGTFHSGDTVSSLLYSIQSSLSTSSAAQVSSGSGECPLYLAFATTVKYVPTCFPGDVSVSFSKDSSVTLTVWLESCPDDTSWTSNTCSGNQLESGGHLDVNIQTGSSDSNTISNVFSCGAGTCGTGVQTVTFSSASFTITAGCGGLLNSCSADIVVLYSYTAVTP